ncbi:hypothetical protein C2S51_000717 [Perilla frutescens var. frutescens]|nr:hypothetical protein C2S51_000717 [Perilla frutescens var. frutescens]
MEKKNSNSSELLNPTLSNADRLWEDINTYRSDCRFRVDVAAAMMVMAITEAKVEGCKDLGKIAVLVEAESNVEAMVVMFVTVAKVKKVVAICSNGGGRRLERTEVIWENSIGNEIAKVETGEEM